MESFEHVRAGLGVRQQCLVSQGCCGDLNVALRHILKVEADQINHAVQCEFELRAQMRRPKKVGDLDDAFREPLLDALQLRWREASLLDAVSQRLVKKRPVVECRKCGSSGHASSP